MRYTRRPKKTQSALRFSQGFFSGEYTMEGFSIIFHPISSHLYSMKKLFLLTYFPTFKTLLYKRFVIGSKISSDSLYGMYVFKSFHRSQKFLCLDALKGVVYKIRWQIFWHFWYPPPVWQLYLT